ncbi:hypothetical protein BAUCODRAFT_158358 [Baudoinia panamericana UAMH 10762]|uniref:Amino acid transporter transmembrane domain-containing protein n=1 Tax=Baudoinia panamericana (strain UAMH 10762) TaxID=717646 RepID=M2ME42_BAUPA|nr:uncharacterized protein BAUCODRAFT_158358 [Baudoinia panamericana UAMH 10762]EMC94851.1 hypothetical protein BAUCODRAFT_158358 [Baudoinia panamericana UAMH 10762]
MTERMPRPDNASRENATPRPAGTSYIRPQDRKLHDPAVSFEEYHYYALRTREEERELPSVKTDWRSLLLRKKLARDIAQRASFPNDSAEQKGHDRNINLSRKANRLEISDQEWTDASRAFRTASWGACFYLITTDILGPGAGIALYTVFGLCAGYSGYLLWHAFLGLDSYKFPLKNYSDLAFRVYGSTARYITATLQALALLLILGQVTIQQGQANSEISKFRLCYAVCPILFLVVGFAIGQIKTLKSYGCVFNLAVWLNLLVIFITMGAFAHTPPNYAISVLGSAGGLVDPTTIKPDTQNYPPIIHYSGMPPSGSSIAALNGLLSGVFAYGGAQLFVEFMAEMRRPRDFIFAMWGAQFFIYAVYLIYGCYTYYFQCQYSYQISYQGVSHYGLQTAGNAIGLLSGLIAAGLYGNIGIKVLYNNVLIDLFGASPLITKGGKIIWTILVPIWWSIAFVIAAAIPDYFGFVSVVAAATIMQFSYSTVGQGFDPQTGVVHRRYSGFEYWARGFISGGPRQVVLNVIHVVYCLGAWVVAGLGLYAAIEGMIEAFKIPQVNSFTCVSPLNLNAGG